MQDDLLSLTQCSIVSFCSLPPFCFLQFLCSATVNFILIIFHLGQLFYAQTMPPPALSDLLPFPLLSCVKPKDFSVDYCMLFEGSLETFLPDTEMKPGISNICKFSQVESCKRYPENFQTAF